LRLCSGRIIATIFDKLAAACIIGRIII